MKPVRGLACEVTSASGPRFSQTGSSMLQTLFLTVVLFIPQGVTLQQAQQAVGVPPLPPPATQPTSITQAEQVQADAESLSALLGRTRIGQLAEGKKKVTLADVRDPAFWVDTVKDLAVTVVMFIPRLIVATLFLFFFWLAYHATRKFLTKALGAADVDESIRDMLGHLIKWA